MKIQNEKGFTLVELMVVVAIIGILSAVAIPNFRKYQAKAKSSEAKLRLAGLYTNAIAFQAEYGTWANCLEVMGADDPANTTVNQKVYYAVGNSAASPLNEDAKDAGAVGCDAGPSFFIATKAVNGEDPVEVISGLGEGTSSSGFVYQARGIISSSGVNTADQSVLSIDDSKNLQVNQLGY